MTNENAPAAPPELVAGLTSPRALDLERFPVRTRDLPVTQSGWRLSVDADQGQGAIVLIEASAGETILRGEGVFLGWTRERLEAAYRALLPRDDRPGLELNQLG
ncbi:MAG: hypothetical protein WEB59_14315 [Thermoanaerobaculia bacterium]